MKGFAPAYRLAKRVRVVDALRAGRYVSYVAADEAISEATAYRWGRAAGLSFDGPATARRQGAERRRALADAVREHGMPINAAAQRFGPSRRSVFRALAATAATATGAPSPTP